MKILPSRCVRGWPAELTLAAGRARQACARGWADVSGGARQPPRPADEAQLRGLRAARRKVAETLQILADAEAMLGPGARRRWPRTEARLARWLRHGGSCSGLFFRGVC